MKHPQSLLHYLSGIFRTSDDQTLFQISSSTYMQKQVHVKRTLVPLRPLIYHWRKKRKKVRHGIKYSTDLLQKL